MTTATQQAPPPYPPRALKPKTHVTSERAAFMPGRRPQTTTTATHASIEATQGALTPAYQPLSQQRRSDPAQWVTERGNAFPPLELVTKPNLTTAELAYYSNMSEQTWRAKACYDSAPEGLRPLRICGRLNWPTAGAKKLLGVA